MTKPTWIKEYLDLRRDFEAAQKNKTFFGEWEDFLFCRLTGAIAELEQWKTWGIIEVSVRNPAVAEYMNHWEGRATKAEDELSRLQWQLIAPENLPKVGDELFANKGRITVVVLSEKYAPMFPLVEDFTFAGWTHFRPINPPKETA